MTFPTVELSLTREYILLLRDSALKMVDAYERILGITPRTSELRQLAKEQKYEQLPKEDDE